MFLTFGGSDNLEKAPIIPYSVNNMTSTFEGCDKLAGTLIIDAQPSIDYNWCLSRTSVTSIKMSNGQTNPMEYEFLQTK